MFEKNGRAAEIRTRDLFHPKEGFINNLQLFPLKTNKLSAEGLGPSWDRNGPSERQLGPFWTPVFEGRFRTKPRPFKPARGLEEKKA